MTNKEVYEVWARENSFWSGWVRPVQFITMDTGVKTNHIKNADVELCYRKYIPKNTAVILDLPGESGVVEAISLARLGFCPIPVYNATKAPVGAMALLDTSQVEDALLWGAKELLNIDISKDAPPAFLLDFNRAEHFKMDISIFDNSWDIYPQDLPSAQYFLEHKIDKILVQSKKIQKDLHKILYNYQEKGIEISFTNGFDTIEKIVLKKPRKSKS